MKLSSGHKLLIDLLPLALFFATYKWANVYTATATLIVATAFTLGFIYFVEKTIAYPALIAALAVGIFGGMTLWLHDDSFIKMKPTLVNMVFAGILFFGVWKNKGWLRYVLGMAFHLTDEGWVLFSKRWGIFFLCLAALNEIVWRNFSENTWVNFKVFGLIGLTLLFAAFQARFIEKHSIKPEKDVQ